jgi:hypothetical protein
MASSKFQKGASGNPKGRAPGQTPGAKRRKEIEARSDDILMRSPYKKCICHN